MKKILRSSGITLIALIITIILLIILAGVTLSISLDQNGLIARTKKTKEEAEIAQEKEYINLAWGTVLIDEKGDATKIASEILQKELNKIITGNETDIKANVEDSTESGKKFKITYIESARIYYIDNYGEVTSIASQTAETPSPYSIFDFTKTQENGKTRGYISLKTRGIYGSGVLESFGQIPYDEENNPIFKIVIPSKWEDGTVITDIAENGFAYLPDITEVTIPASVERIGENAFGWKYEGSESYRSKISNIKIEAGSKLNSIGAYAFYYCNSIISLTLENCNELTTIGDESFENCSSLTDISKYGFYNNSSLTNITIPSSVITMGYDVFTNCNSLSTINVPFQEGKKPAGWNDYWNNECPATINYAK